MAKYQIKYALGGGYGGTTFLEWETIEEESLEAAEQTAYMYACELYCNECPTDFKDEYPEADEEEIESLMEEDCQSWIDYDAQPYRAEDDPKSESFM